jgi:cytochrome c peroxidase
MAKHLRVCGITCLCLLSAAMLCFRSVFAEDKEIGREVAIPKHMQDGEEYKVSIPALIDYGRRLFDAMWTSQEGAGRPLTKGTGAPLSDAHEPLVFPHNFNRISGPDTNSCSGCHNKPYIGGGGDIVSNVFVLGQRFDFATFNQTNTAGTQTSADEIGNPTTLQSIANFRKTISMSGSGFIEMLARQITADLQAIRDATPPGGSRALTSKGISFGTIRRNANGTWDTSQVIGISALSVKIFAPDNRPSLVIRPFHQAGNVVSLREFGNSAFNHHHGMQSEERFGIGVDADGDGVANELTRADITAATIFQATMPVPGRRISTDPEVHEAVIMGEKKFRSIGCATCHVESLPLDHNGWIFSEPGPYNPHGNIRAGEVPVLNIDLTSDDLPQPRLKATNGVVYVPAYTDLKLHDITSGPGDPNREPLDMNQTPGTAAFFAGNGKFVTRKLWGIANQHSFGHHGMYTTMREAVLAHAGEAAASAGAFRSASKYDQDCIIEFLKSLQILPLSAKSLCVDQNGKDIQCPAGILP